MSKISAAAGKQAKNTTSSKFGQRYSVISGRNPPSQKKWVFGFQYFKQIENFGLDASKIKNTWLLSVIDRFTELAPQNVEDVIGDYKMAEAARCHEINWQQKNIPIQRKDLDWIPEEYRATEEFPLLQFSVSKAMGRVLGFFDQDWIFQIVLLDPLHNAQPSKSYEYKVDLCHPLGCELIALKKKVDDTIRVAKKDCDCGIAVKLTRVLEQPAMGTATVFCISRDDLHSHVFELIHSNLATSIQDILAEGVDAILSKDPPEKCQG